jgi:hypothetical protein
VRVVGEGRITPRSSTPDHLAELLEAVFDAIVETPLS